jgi:hypothetical protein
MKEALKQAKKIKCNKIRIYFPRMASSYYAITYITNRKIDIENNAVVDC